MTDLTIYRGDDKTFNLAFTDGDGVGIDITGWTIFFTLKNARVFQDDTNDTDALIEKTVTSHSDPTIGLSAFSIGASDTSSLTPKTYVFDIQIKDSGGNIKTIIKGDFVLSADVTRRTS